MIYYSRLRNALPPGIAPQLDQLRAQIIPLLLKNLSENKHQEYPQNLFEIGTVFKGLCEKPCLGVVLCGEEEDYTRAKQVLEALMEGLGLAAVYEECEDSRFIAGRAAEVLLNKAVVGVIGEVHPAVLENFSLETPASAFELDLELLFKKFKEEG